MAEHLRPDIEPSLLVWARETAGYSVYSAAQKINVAAEKLSACEAGNAKLTFRQLQEAANVYKRPLAIFFLERPPAVEPSIHDFRMDPSVAGMQPEPSVKIELRRARLRRDEALELADQLDHPVRPFTHDPVSIGEDVEEVGSRIAQLLGTSLGLPRTVPSMDQALKTRKRAVERLGILVFEASRVPVAAMRGASLPFDTLPIIILNGADAPAGRSFTLLHELTHLLLRQGGLCDLSPTKGHSHDAKLESFCNAVSAAAMMPAQILHPMIGDKSVRNWTMDELRDLATPFRVSREAMLLRLVSLGYATRAHYFGMRGAFLREYQEFKDRQRADSKDKDGGPSPAVMAVRNLGVPFVELVLDAIDSDRIGLATASDYLGIKVKQIHRVRELVSHRGAAA